MLPYQNKNCLEVGVDECARGCLFGRIYGCAVVYPSNGLNNEFESEDFEQRGPVSFFGDPNRDESQNTNSLAIEYRYDTSDFHLSASARYDENNDFKDSSSWRVTSSVERRGKTYYGSIGKSVKNPSFSERFGFFTNFTGNPNLKPEQSLHWEIGIRGLFLSEDFGISATYFQ